MNAAEPIPIYPMGADGDTGEPLPPVSDAEIWAYCKGGFEQPSEQARQAIASKAIQLNPNYGTSGAEVDDSNDLAQTGWGVIFSRSAGSPIQEALAPLLRARAGAAGELYKEFREDSIRDAFRWLTAKGLNLDHPVTPSKGVPYYILIVAPPTEVSFEFQYTLAMQWAVGRVWFDGPLQISQFRQYAESVVRYETQLIVETSRQTVLFAPCREGDRATEMFTEHVANPIAALPHPYGIRRNFRNVHFLGAHASQPQLAEVFQGRLDGGRPALLFSGSHGARFKPEDPLLPARQGRLVCQKVGDGTHYFGAEELSSSANLHGLIHFCFACYGAGCPKSNTFQRQQAVPDPVAPEPIVSRLPQALLSHPNGGALAFVGHVDMAWSLSFRSAEGVAQIDAFKDAIGKILKGDRIGLALDRFLGRSAIFSERLVECQLRWEALSSEERAQAKNLRVAIAEFWKARDDARNFIILGDPAVRMRSSEMPPVVSSEA